MKHDVDRLHALTGLRFVAAFAVFVHHLDARTGASVNAPLGAYGVGFFFVLSGFILTYVYVQRAQTEPRRFMFSRWARIWPLHIVTLLATLQLFQTHFRSQVNDSAWTWLRLPVNALLLQSWVPLENWSLSFNQVSWSISTELFFYLAFPFLAIRGEKRFWKSYAWIVSMTVVAAVGLQLVSASTSVGDYISVSSIIQTNPLFRLLEFATGIGLGFLFLRHTGGERRSRVVEWLEKRWPATLIETLVVAVVVALPVVVARNSVMAISTLPNDREVLAYWFRFSGGVYVFAVVIFVFGASRGHVSRFFGSRAMTFLGDISFAFYLTHFLVLRKIRTYEWAASELDPILLGVAAMVISIGVSTILFRVVEMPMRTALIEFRDGRKRASFDTVIKSTKAFVLGRAAVPAALCIVLPTLLLAIRYTAPEFTPAMQQMRRESPSPHRSVRFDNGMRMMGTDVTRTDAGYEVQILWLRTYDAPIGDRFSEIRDAAGNRIGTGARLDGDEYSRRQLGEPFIETIVFAESVMDGGASVVVRFDRDRRAGPAIDLVRAGSVSSAHALEGD